MSIEVPVNDDIREYDSKAVGNFTTRQAGALAVFIIVELPIILLTNKILEQAVILPIVVTGFPIIAFGFWKPRGFNFEDYIRLKFNNISQLQARGYKNSNGLRELEKVCLKYELLEKNKKHKKRLISHEK